MKAERISKNQVRFTLNHADLKARHIRIADLSYGSDKAKALFEDMMQQAIAEFGFDLQGNPVMIEAIPVSEDSLMITMTQVAGQEDLIHLFRSNIPGADMGPMETDMRFQMHADGLEQALEPQDLSLLFKFDSFDELMEGASVVAPNMRLRNTLYKEEETGSFYVHVQFSRNSGKLRYTLAALSEFASETSREPLRVTWLKEHGKTVIAARALQKLSAMAADNEAGK